MEDKIMFILVILPVNVLMYNWLEDLLRHGIIRGHVQEGVGCLRHLQTYLLIIKLL